jgi:hypothetical protein
MARSDTWKRKKYTCQVPSTKYGNIGSAKVDLESG